MYISINILKFYFILFLKYILKIIKYINLKPKLL